MFEFSLEYRIFKVQCACVYLETFLKLDIVLLVVMLEAILLFETGWSPLGKGCPGFVYANDRLFGYSSGHRIVNEL